MQDGIVTHGAESVDQVMCGPELLLGRGLPRTVLRGQLLQGLEYLV